MNIQCFFSISKHITLIGKPFIWVVVSLSSLHNRQSGLSASPILCLRYARSPYPINISIKVFASVLLSLRISAARLEFRCSPMRVLTCLHIVALCHSCWCYAANQLLISSVTDLFEIVVGTTGSRSLGFYLATSIASLSAILFALASLCPGIQGTVTGLPCTSLFNALKHSRTSIEMATGSSNFVTAVLLSDQMWMLLPWP